MVANATQHAGKSQTLSSDTAGKTGFIEALYANQVAFGQIYRYVLRQSVEAIGYPVENAGPHGMWEFQGIDAVIDAFSKRRHSIRDAVVEDASLKSRDVATLDTSKAKVASDPATLVVQWLQEMKDVGFYAQACLAAGSVKHTGVPGTDANAGRRRGGGV